MASYLNPFQSVGATENTTTEFKSSLFFRPGIHIAGDEQMDVITRTIASLINTEGGDLWIGVDDNGFASDSIIGEYQYLNSFPPYLGNSYPLNHDGYKRFISDWVALNLGNFAVSLLSFDFLTFGSVEVCKVHAKKSNAPVWFKRDFFYVRSDASTRQLRGNDITCYMLNVDKSVFASAQQANKAAADKVIADIKATKTKPQGTLLVVYPDGSFIHESSSVAAMLKVIHKAGIDNVINLSLAGRAGRAGTPYVPFIGNVLHNTGAGSVNKSQKLLDGYLVFVKYSVGEILTKVTEISNGLGLGLHVELY